MSAYRDNYHNTYTDEFQSFLARVQAQYGTTLAEIPMDEPRIDIDLDSREIKINESEYNDFLCVATDHRSQTIYFEVDRYFEDVDLFNCTCIIEYINAGNHPRLYPVTLKTLYNKLEEDGTFSPKMILAWNIGSEATIYPGIIKFAFNFYKTIYDVDEYLRPINCKIIYSLNTKPAVGTIVAPLEYTDELLAEQEDIYTLEPDIYQNLVAMINQKNVYWNDL